jgi:hypothetical protein
MEHTAHKTSKTINLILGILVIILVFLVVSLISSYRQSNIGRIIHSHVTALKNNETSAGRAVNVSAVQSWMTFDYINRLFGLPPDYLKATLAISDPVYPHLTLLHYSHLQGTSMVQGVAAVKEAIEAYLAPTK